MENQETWEGLKTSWTSYKEVIESWVSAVDESKDEKEVDSLLHDVIHTHNHWAQLLGEVIEKTHRH